MAAADHFLSGELGVGETVPEKVAALQAWKEGHEQRCADRQAEVLKKIDGQGRLMLAMLLAVLGWSLIEVYRLQTTHATPAPVQAAPPTIIYAPPGAAPVVVNPVQGQMPQLPAPPATSPP